MDNSRKRRSSNPSLANCQPTKRYKVDSIHNAFTKEQHAVIENTASFFQIHTSDLAAAIGSLRRSSVAPSYQHRPSHPEYIQQPLSYFSSTSEDSFSSQAAMGNEWESSSSSSRDRNFGFNVPVTTWSTCFSNMLADDDSFVPSTTRQMTYTGTESTPQSTNRFTPAIPSQAPLLSNRASTSSDHSAYADTSYDPGNQEPEDNSLCSSIFACDAPFRISSSWQPSHNNLSKPPVPQPRMTYAQQLDPNLSNYDFSPSESGPLIPVGLTDTQQTALQKTSVSYEECPLIDFNIDDDSSRPKRGPFKNPAEKAQTAQTRKDNACVRCKMQRTRCIPDPFDPRGVCLTCKKVANTRVVNLPCLRYKIPDAALFREGYVPGLEWSRRWDAMEMNDISTWSDPKIKLIQVTQGYSPNPVVLRVRKFIPVPGDKLSRKWVHAGKLEEAVVPPFAIENMKEAERTYRDYIAKEGIHFFLSTLDRKDALIFDTYTMAIQASKSHMSEQERVLLNMVLRLWVVARMTCRSETIVGSEHLDMPPDLMGPTSPLCGQTPIPPVMGRQIEVILIQGIMKPLRTMILEHLQKLILAHKPQNWFCIYLCIFILLHSASLITKTDIEYAKKHGLTRKFAMPAMVEELHMGVNVLLAYYHYACRGQRPFSLEWDANDAVSMAILDDDQVKFLKRTAVHVQANASKHREIRQPSSCDHPHHFISQLYEQDWEPRSSTRE
ncbi:hypothetical protein ONS95_008450 [Cadophora gregata]|uniref:uncharacterized protein n=1 Tax=Cadophora gregata TaxID=51156 RepID=UPI0026DAF905|nr:uncharacterized protein ONS95_008450 [Cadophora gregata]KAK0126871.1 hypothetical protein ONS95_008450 [Cadophora gregata]